MYRHSVLRPGNDGDDTGENYEGFFHYLRPDEEVLLRRNGGGTNKRLQTVVFFLFFLEPVILLQETK